MRHPARSAPPAQASPVRRPPAPGPASACVRLRPPAPALCPPGGYPMSADASSALL